MSTSTSALGFDFDWLVIGSGFGGSTAALRLSEKGHQVAVLERGRRYQDHDLPKSAWQLSRFLWAPVLGFRGVMKMRVFRHVFFPSQSAVGGGSTVYGGVLFRARDGFFDNPQWRDMANWKEKLNPHYQKAEHMLGVRTVPFTSTNQQFARAFAKHLGKEDAFKLAPTGVYFGVPGEKSADPYFNGEGPERTGCTRCGACMVGCRTGAVNSLTKNYLWFAEKRGAQIIPEREVVNVRPLGALDGSDGYEVVTQRPGAWLRKDTKVYKAKGVVFAAGALGTNELLAHCKQNGSLPKLSSMLGKLVRTNSESVLNVRLSKDLKTWNDVTASSCVRVDDTTQIEFLTYGTRADLMGLMYTVLVGKGTPITRPLKWLGKIVRHPMQWLKTLWPAGWSRHMVTLLVMQTLDNCIEFQPQKKWFSARWKVVTRQHAGKPNPTYIEAANHAAQWLASYAGGIAQSNVLEAVANIPTTAHVLGGAVIGADAMQGVIDENLKVFGYHNMLVCDGSAMPANPGVNPALTITALAEHAMANLETTLYREKS